MADIYNHHEIEEKWQKVFYEEYGLHFIHAGDEWYLNAGLEVPEEDLVGEHIPLF